MGNISYKVVIKSEKNTKDENGLSKYDEVMLHENGSAIQEINPTHEIQNVCDTIVSEKMDALIEIVLSGICEHNWTGDMAKTKMYQFAKEIELELNNRISDDYKGLFEIKPYIK